MPHVHTASTLRPCGAHSPARRGLPDVTYRPSTVLSSSPACAVVVPDSVDTPAEDTRSGRRPGDSVSHEDPRHPADAPSPSWGRPSGSA